MRQGFTLAELLIALAILGVIATFTIPKVLQSQQDEKRKSVYREVIANLNEAIYTARLQGVILGTNLDEELRVRLNHVKYCTDGVANGCWTHTYPASITGTENEGGFILHNGAVVGGLNTTAGATDESVAIDWNGAALPNLEGEDQMVVRFCYRTDGLNCGGGQRPGTLRWSPAGDASSQTLYETIFKN